MITWKDAYGHTIKDDKGKKYIDLTSGIFVTNAGHSNPAIVKAIREQELLFAYHYPTAIKDKFLKKLREISPPHFKNIILRNTGSEAMEVAYRILKETGRKYIISFKGSYHGSGLGGQLLAGKAGWSGIKDNIHIIDFPYGEEQFYPSKLPQGDQIAGIVLETFQGWGAWFYPKEFIQDLCKYAKSYGILVCFDDMQGGFYRLGTLYGYMIYGYIEPDILCLGKGFTSSLPLAAVLTNQDTDIMHGTQSANPVCLAAALANIEFLEKYSKTEKFKHIQRVFKEEIEAIGWHTEVNYKGMIAGIIFKDEKTATSVVNECIKRGVLLVHTGRESIKIGPPLIITEKALRKALKVVRDVIHAQLS